MTLVRRALQLARNNLLVLPLIAVATAAAVAAGTVLLDAMIDVAWDVPASNMRMFLSTVAAATITTNAIVSGSAGWS